MYYLERKTIYYAQSYKCFIRIAGNYIKCYLTVQGNPVYCLITINIFRFKTA